jgi:hypothetical protein
LIQCRVPILQTDFRLIIIVIVHDSILGGGV